MVVGARRAHRLGGAARRRAGRPDGADRAVDRRVPDRDAPARSSAATSSTSSATWSAATPSAAPGTKWVRLDTGDVTDLAALAEATPTKMRAGINDLVVVRIGDTVHAMHTVCAHAGGPLDEGPVVDGCIECPWHGSRFRLDRRARQARAHGLRPAELRGPRRRGRRLRGSPSATRPDARNATAGAASSTRCRSSPSRIRQLVLSSGRPARASRPSRLVSSRRTRSCHPTPSAPSSSGDEADQRASRVAFRILHRTVERRLAARAADGRRRHERRVDRPATAARSGRALPACPSVAIVLDLGLRVVHARNAARARVVDPDVIDRHLAADPPDRRWRSLATEGIRPDRRSSATPAEAAALVVERRPLGPASTPG